MTKPKTAKRNVPAKAAVPRLPTGIEGLDDILEGGFPAHRIYLIEGEPGTGKTTLALQYLMEGVRRGEFRSDLDTRLAVLGILGMANAVANWYRAEEVAIDRVSAEFARLLVAGVAKRPKPRRRSIAARRSAG